MKHIKLFEQFINEAVEISNPIDGKEVVIMPGRFQPFHKGHLIALENASKQFDMPVIPIQVVSKKDKSPFPEKLLQQIGDDVAKNESYIEKFFIYPQGYGLTVIPWFVRFLRDNGYETVGVAAGSDREKAYAGQMKYITSERTDTIVSPDFEMKIVDQRVEGGPSGTKVRETLAADDQEAFNELVPTYLHKYYRELKKYI